MRMRCILQLWVRVCLLCTLILGKTFEDAINSLSFSSSYLPLKALPASLSRQCFPKDSMCIFNLKCTSTSALWKSNKEAAWSEIQNQKKFCWEKGKKNKWKLTLSNPFVALPYAVDWRLCAVEEMVSSVISYAGRRQGNWKTLASDKPPNLQRK